MFYRCVKKTSNVCADVFWDNSYKWIDENTSAFMKDLDGIQQVKAAGCTLNDKEKQIYGLSYNSIPVSYDFLCTVRSIELRPQR